MARTGIAELRALGEVRTEIADGQRDAVGVQPARIDVAVQCPAVDGRLTAPSGALPTSAHRARWRR